MSIQRDPLLFDLGVRRDAETPIERQRRLNAARQRRWRERHQMFYVPENVYEGPSSRTTTSTEGRDA
jgi:hypothetical protein